MADLPTCSTAPPTPAFHCPFDSGPLYEESMCPDAPQAGSSDDADSIAANAVYDAAVEMHADDVAAFDAAFAAGLPACGAKLILWVCRSPLLAHLPLVGACSSWWPRPRELLLS